MPMLQTPCNIGWITGNTRGYRGCESDRGGSEAVDLVAAFASLWSGHDQKVGQLSRVMMALPRFHDMDVLGCFQVGLYHCSLLGRKHAVRSSPLHLLMRLLRAVFPCFVTLEFALSGSVKLEGDRRTGPNRRRVKFASERSG